MAYIIYVWENTLQHHFIREEKTINPNLENRPEGKVLVERMMAEHLIFNKLIRRIKSNAKGTDAIGKFAELLNKHIRFEERDLFPLLEKTATNKELTAIGIILGDSYHSTCNNWPIKFWEQPQNAVGLKA